MEMSNNAMETRPTPKRFNHQLRSEDVGQIITHTTATMLVAQRNKVAHTAYETYPVT